MRNINFTYVRWPVVLFFHSWFHLYGYCLSHISTPVFLFLLSSRFPLPLTVFPPEVSDLKTWPQPFPPMLYRICPSAQENCGKPMPIQSAISQSVPSLQFLKKWPPAQRFDMQAADRRSPIQVLTPTTHRTLSLVTSCILFLNFKNFSVS